MALVTHHMRGSNATFPSRSLSWNKQTDLKRFVTVLHCSANKDRFLSLRCKSCFNIGAPVIRVSKSKSLKISAFKGGARDDDSSGRSSGSMSKNAVKLSYVHKGSEEAMTESPKVQDVPLSYVSEPDETVSSRSLAIQNLFKSWLTLLRSQPPKQVVEEEALEVSDSGNTLVAEDEKQKGGRNEIMKAALCYFWGLDAKVKIPILIFIPLYLGINVMYGAEVSKELTPLWVFGPLVAAVYVKLFQLLCGLYVYCFKLTVKLVKNSPTYSSEAYSYVASGKLKEFLITHSWFGFKNMSYKELSEKMKTDFQEWATEKYLDFVESIWPTYCRTIRFLKRANLI